MKTYKVRVLQSAEADIDELADFLFEKPLVPNNLPIFAV